MSYSNFDKEVNNILDLNLANTTKDAEWDTYEVGGEKKVYPFWKSVIAGPGETFKDFLKWSGENGGFKEEDMVGIVKPLKPEFDVNTVQDSKISHDFKTKIETNLEKLEKTPKLGELEDKTGVVKPKEDLAKIVVPKIKKSKEEKSELEDKTGVVKPESEFGGNAKPEIDNDFSEPTDPVLLYDWSESLLDKFKKIKVKD